MSSLQSGTVNLFIKLIRQNLFLEKLEPQTHRSSFERISNITKFPRGVTMQRGELAGLPAGYFTPEKMILPDTVVLYLHGGGYFAGSYNTHRALIGRIARAAGCLTVGINYSKAPENPYPAALDDAVICYRALLKDGYRRIVIGGDSAGGGLSMATMLRLRDEGEHMPIGAVLLSPWTDLTISGQSIITNRESDALLPADLLPVYAQKYYGSHDPKDPYISPLFGEFHGIPPTYIQVSDAETILDDSLRLAKKMRQDGCDVNIQVWNDCMHVWQFLGGIMPEANRAISKIGEFIVSLK